MTATWFHLLISYQVLVWFGLDLLYMLVINEISQSNICINYFLIKKKVYSNKYEHQMLKEILHPQQL